jgi:hypothetical protein
MIRLFLVAICLQLFAFSRLSAQATPVRVYLDCQHFGCDEDYFVREITFVDYVRSPQDADVHILVTRQDTGGGGDAYSASFIGQHAFAGTRDSLSWFAPQGATDDEVREGLARTFKLGLVRFVARSPVGRDLVISYRGPRLDSLGTTPRKDPWNFWVFRAEAQTNLEGESHQNSTDLDGGFSANRNTDDLKLSLELDGSYEKNSFEVDSTETITSTQKEYGAEASVVKTLGPHWGLAFGAAANRSSYNNRALGLRAAAGLEYDIFPYSASARRLLTIRYQVGTNYYRYDELTVYQKMRETLVDHALEVELDATQPWGTAGVELRARQYLNDLSKNSLRFSTDLEVRLVKGLSLELDGSISRVRDQLYLPAEGLTPAEILLQQQELATDYRYFLSAGFSYSFGSIFNNVVNPRFGSGSADLF